MKLGIWIWIRNLKSMNHNSQKMRHFIHIIDVCGWRNQMSVFALKLWSIIVVIALNFDTSCWTISLPSFDGKHLAYFIALSCNNSIKKGNYALNIFQKKKYFYLLLNNDFNVGFCFVSWNITHAYLIGCIKINIKIIQIKNKTFVVKAHFSSIRNLLEI